MRMLDEHLQFKIRCAESAPSTAEWLLQWEATQANRAPVPGASSSSWDPAPAASAVPAPGALAADPVPEAVAAAPSAGPVPGAAERASSTSARKAVADEGVARSASAPPAPGSRKHDHWWTVKYGRPPYMPAMFPPHSRLQVDFNFEINKLFLKPRVDFSFNQFSFKEFLMFSKNRRPAPRRSSRRSSRGSGRSRPKLSPRRHPVGAPRYPGAPSRPVLGQSCWCQGRALAPLGPRHPGCQRPVGPRHPGTPGSGPELRPPGSAPPAGPSWGAGRGCGRSTWSRMAAGRIRFSTRLTGSSSMSSTSPTPAQAIIFIYVLKYVYSCFLYI